jgi:hypothetical protein
MGTGHAQRHWICAPAVGRWTVLDDGHPVVRGRDTVVQRERQEWQPKVASRHDEPTVSAEIQEVEISA